MPRRFTSVSKASAAPVGRIVPASQRWTLRLCAHSKRANPAWLKPLSWRTAGFRPPPSVDKGFRRSEEHTSELQSLMRISYAVFCLNKKKESAHQYQQHNRIYKK